MEIIMKFTDKQMLDYLESKAYSRLEDSGYSATFCLYIPQRKYGMRVEDTLFDYSTLREAIQAEMSKVQT